MIIKKGNYYECINTVFMGNGEIAYQKGFIYKSEEDDCITDIQGSKNHVWSSPKKTYYFKEVVKPLEEEVQKEDMVNHPSHYTKHPSGVECIEITRHYCFSIGNAIKYLWRAGLKSDSTLKNKEKEIEDLKKSIWYIQDRIEYLEKE